MEISILIFFAIAFALVFAFRLMRIGVLLGMLCAGIIAGPFGLGIFQLTDIWALLGQLGIMFLWFTLGLEINFIRLWRMRKTIFGFGAAQVLMVAVMMFPILFGLTTWTIMGTVMVSLVLAMSSTPNDLQILADRNELQTDLGRQTFSILLFQDLLVIPLMAMLPIFAGRTINLGGQVIDILVMSVGLILGVVIVGRLLFNPLMRLVSKLKSKEASLLVIMLNIILWAVVFGYIGLPMGLGAFLAGMLFSETIYRHQIKADISPYAIMFMSFFFIALGLGLDLNLLRDNWIMLVIGVAGLLVVKIAAIYMVARVRNVAGRSAFLMALILAQGGEFGLLILQTMKDGGISAVPGASGEILTAIIILSMLIAPLLLCLYDIVHRSGKLFSSRNSKKINGEKIVTPAVIICGFGRVGQIMAKMMVMQNVSYVAIDMDVDAVMRGRDDGYNVFYGDTSDAVLLRAMGLTPRKTRAVIIALNNAWKSKSTVRAVRSIAPNVKLFARARNLEEMNVLQGEGVSEALPETVESSFRLGFSVLERVGIKPDIIRQMLLDLRANNYEKLTSQ